MEAKGNVEGVSFKNGKYGLKLNGQWFNGFGKPECKKGDQVEIEFEQNDNWKNVKSLKVVSSNSSSNSEPTNAHSKFGSEIQKMSELKNKTNAKICALNCANSLYLRQSEVEEFKGTDSQVIERVVSLAKELLKFLEGEPSS